MTTRNIHRLYGNRGDPREFPAYLISDVARYVGIPYHQLYHWLRPVSFMGVNGRSKMPVIRRPRTGSKLSFLNLVEAHVVRAILRANKGVRLTEIRAALDYAEREGNISRLLLHPDLKAGAGGLFLEHYGELINLSKAGQIALRKSFDRHIERIDFEHSVLYPITEGCADKIISISPYIAFGKPVVGRRGVSTEVLAERINLGEDPEFVARDYGLEIEEVEEAILYEQRAA